MSIEKYNRLLDAAKVFSLTPVVDDDFTEVKYELDSAIYALNKVKLSFSAFSYANVARCQAESGFNHSIASWSGSDWMTAVTGELGEAANIIKKLNRVRDGVPGNSETEDELRAGLADEIADTFIYLDLLAQRYGLNVDDIIKDKFNRTSEKIGYTKTL